MDIFLVDTNPEIIKAWNLCFDGEKNVYIFHSEI